MVSHMAGRGWSSCKGEGVEMCVKDRDFVNFYVKKEGNFQILAFIVKKKACCLPKLA